MKILHVIPLISPAAEYGGPVRGTMRQASGALEMGHEVAVLSLWPAATREIKPTDMLGVPLILFAFRLRVPGHRFAGLWSFRALWWLWIQARHYDVVHIHAGREVWVHVAARILKLRRVPYLWQSHGMIAPRTRLLVRLMDRLFTRSSVQQAESVLFLTPVEKAEFELQFELDNLSQLINGVESAVNAESAPTYEDGSALRLVVTSRVQRRKRIPELAQAVAACRRNGMQLELVIFGPDEGDLARVQATIQAESAEGYISYGGTLAYDEVRTELSRHHVLALSSVDEPFPNSVLEGMASGLVPLVCTSCGLAPYLTEAGAGLVVGDDNQQELVAALFELCGSHKLYQELQSRSLALARSTFEMAAVSQRLDGLYVDAVQHKLVNERAPI